MLNNISNYKKNAGIKLFNSTIQSCEQNILCNSSKNNHSTDIMRLEARDVHFRYSAKSPEILRGVNFSVAAGERVGIIAPSGFGKTTFVKILAGYERPTQGDVLLNGAPLPTRGFSPVQLIHQHPETAVNPRWRMRQVLEEANLCKNILPKLGIEPAWLERFPRELSGGELQRFCVARALAPPTRFVIADEMSAMLDAVTQAQIWSFLLEEVVERSLGLIVVTHNAALAERVCERVVDLATLS